MQVKLHGDECSCIWSGWDGYYGIPCEAQRTPTIDSRTRFATSSLLSRETSLREMTMTPQIVAMILIGMPNKDSIPASKNITPTNCESAWACCGDTYTSGPIKLGKAWEPNQRIAKKIPGTENRMAIVSGACLFLSSDIILARQILCGRRVQQSNNPSMDMAFIAEAPFYNP